MNDKPNKGPYFRVEKADPNEKTYDAIISEARGKGQKYLNVDSILEKISRELASTGDDKLATDRIERLKEIASKYRGEDEIISFSDIAERIKINKDELKIFTGWERFDNIVSGFRLGQLVVVSALTKSGKTSWLMDLTTRIKQFNPLWFPFEESAEELIRKFVERGETPPHGYTPSVTRQNALEWIECRIVESIAKYDTKVVVIDQLDFIIPYSGDNRADRIGTVMQDLKKMAKKWNVCIFLICHLSKTRMDTEPTMEELRGSSSIGQTADTVIMLWREMRRESGKVVITSNTNVSIQANRRVGTTGNVEMIFDKGHYREEAWSSGMKADKEFDDF